MATFKNLALALHNDEDAATATEYIILVVLIACFLMAMVAIFGDAVSAKFNEAKAEVAGMDVNRAASSPN